MTTYKYKTNFYSLQQVGIIAGIVMLYFIISFFLIGFKSDQIVLAAIFCCAYFGGATSRKFIVAFSIFIVYWILFDYMKAFPNYNHATVHIMQLHNMELSYFGIPLHGKFITPNEYWLLHKNTFLDVLTGIFYLCWIPVPLAFACFLFFKNKQLFLQFAFNFVLVNMIGFIIYYLYPAAPPWYLQINGPEFIANTHSNSAGLQNFDKFFNLRIFNSIYAKGSNVFAAMPSLHSSYPVIVLYYGIKKRLGWLNIIFAIVMAGIWFAAVYNSHHYLLDVLAGIACALFSILFFQQFLLKTNWFKRFMGFYLSKI